jgi:homoserine kinase type II
LFFEVAGQTQYLRRRLRPGEIVLFEEGLVHRAVNLFAWEPGLLETGPVKTYFERLPAQGLVVLVHTPLETSLERATARGLPLRLRDKEPQAIERFMHNSGRILETAAAALTEMDRPMIEVDNSGDLDESICALHSGLEKWFGPAVPGQFSTPVYEPGLAIALPRPDRLARRLRHGRSGVRLDPYRDLLDQFGLKVQGTASAPGGPGRSDILVLETAAGKKLLKRYKASVELEAVQHEHSILSYLAQTGFPSPRLSPALNGDTVLQKGERYYALFDYLEGYFQYHNYYFLPAQSHQLITASGQALAALHLALREFEPAGRHLNGFISKEGSRWRDLDWYLDRLDQARQAIPGLRAEEESRLLPDFSGQAAWLKERLCELDSRLKAANPPRLIIHGDYGPYNLFFRPGAPIVILDFELARLDWRLSDLAHSLHYFAMNRFGFQADKMHLFLQAYNARYPLDPGELEFLPSVWQFLLLRRVIVCWQRYGDTRARFWLEEAQHKLNLAHWLDTNPI